MLDVAEVAVSEICRSSAWDRIAFLLEYLPLFGEFDE